MNVFVLNTGRCGSLTFIHACRHIENYSAAHESRCDLLGQDRFNYPSNHIEADNRLTWFLGRLDAEYGKSAFYVHLQRDTEATARSFAKRYASGIIRAYREDLLKGLADYPKPMDVCLDYCNTVTHNVNCFLKDKTRKMTFRLEHASEDFRPFWEVIEARGDYEAAVAEFSTAYNATPTEGAPVPKRGRPSRALAKFCRLLWKFPSYAKHFIRHA